MHWKFFVEILFKHYSDSEMYLKLNRNTFYTDSLAQQIFNNDLPPTSVFAEHRDGKQAMMANDTIDNRGASDDMNYSCHTTAVELV